MNLNREWRIRLTQILLGGAVVIALVMVRGIHAGEEPLHLVTDWSHRHVIFSAPKNLMQQFQLSGNVRYVQQWVRRNVGNQGGSDGWRWRHGSEDSLHGDWNVYMGNVGTVGAGNYPAKYSFNAGAANCGTAAQPDFVVYNTSLAGSATAVAGFDTGTFSLAAASGSTITITNPNTSKTLVLTAGTTNSSSGTGTGTFNAGGNATASATGLFNSIQTTGNGSYVGVSATNPSAGVVTVTAATAGTTGNSITVTASTSPASNFTLTFANLVNGATGVPTIVAFDNLYSGCTGTVPSTYWAYNTGTTDAVVTSPTLSGDGTQVAFIQSTSGGAANLVLLRWAANSGTVDSPATPTTETPTSYYNSGAGCAAPCMVTIAFGNGAADTQSSPFYDYAPGADTLYVGDSTGYIHKFTPVFKGIPAEVTTTWPVQMATAPLSSPVYDAVSGKVFANASFQVSNDSGGRLHSLCATGTACGTAGVTGVASGIMGPATNGTTCESTGPTSGDADNLLMDAPVLDPTNEVIYEVIGNDGTGKSALFQFPTSYTSGSCGTEITLGTGSTNGVPVYAGNFDNLYYSGSAGHFYVCGDAGGDPTLYQITVSSAGIASGTANSGAALTTAATKCGPVVEVYNPGTNPPSTANDWIFTSVQASGQTATPISCPANSGCIMSFNVLSGANLTISTTTVGHTSVAGGASGVIVDNTVGSGTLAGASQVYFTPLTTGNCTTSAGHGIGGCAIQASQSALN
ncbi:MAG: hypothetical protein WB621_15815 [Candidatus Acidiferrales bacterium]